MVEKYLDAAFQNADAIRPIPCGWNGRLAAPCRIEAEGTEDQAEQNQWDAVGQFKNVPDGGKTLLEML